MLPILIVDDEPAIAALISRVLTAAGYICQAVTSSEKAADLIEQNRYDLVLLDVAKDRRLRPTGIHSPHGHAQHFCYGKGCGFRAGARAA